MSFYRGPNIVTNGLVLSLDAGNVKSYPGSGTTWSDKSGNNNNGTLTNGPTFSSANGGSIVFDGVDDYVDINTQIQFERTQSFSLSAWVNSTNSNNNQIINNEDINYKGYQFVINTSGYLQLILRNTPTTNFIGVASNNTIPTNTWVYLIATYNGSSLASGVTLYVNSIAQPTTVSGDNLTQTTISGQTTWIGYRRPVTQGPFSGRISIAQIYNRALSASEVLQNYNALKSRFNLT